MKRALDVVLATIALIVASPVMLLVMLWIRQDSPGPAFYRQTRIGQGGREFKILKFRSMVTNADRIGGYSTQQGDLRITSVGRFIRKTSLDELPQLINVLLGDMSVVGPRPDVPAQREQYTESEWHQRHVVRPGITGLAQATLRSQATPAQRKELDLHYAAHLSTGLDFKIILMTVRQVLTKGGN